jgi:hypothetical protein
VDQYVEVGRRTIDALRLRRFDVRRHRPQRSHDDKDRRNVVNGTQRENRTIVVVHRRRMVIRMVLEKPVGGQMPVDENVDVTLLLGFVHVFGRSDWEHSHHDA